jgi:hypothetical protein
MIGNLRLEIGGPRDEDASGGDDPVLSGIGPPPQFQIT